MKGIKIQLELFQNHYDFLQSVCERSKKTMSEAVGGLVDHYIADKESAKENVLVHEIKKALKKYEGEEVCRKWVVTDNLKINAKQLREQGFSQHEIANAMGVSRGSVIRALK